MEFEVKRTSLSGFANSPPCKDAVQRDGKWYIKIPTLKGLIEFVENQYSRCIIRVEGSKRDLEIYDDYRE